MSKSATQKKELTVASNALRWKLIAGLGLGLGKDQGLDLNQNQEFGGLMRDSEIREKVEN